MLGVIKGDTCGVDYGLYELLSVERSPMDDLRVDIGVPLVMLHSPENIL